MVSAHRALRLAKIAIALSLGACASLVGIEDVVVVGGDVGGGDAGDAGGDDGIDGGDAPPVDAGPSGRDGGTCLTEFVISKCKSGEFTGFQGGTPCVGPCDCSASTYCMTKPGSSVGTCGSARSCGAPCKANWDCASMTCTDFVCR